MASINLQGDTSGSISISAPSVAGSNTLTLPATTQTLATQNSLGVRNLIINGDMRIAQRGTSASGLTTSDYRTVDRWKFSIGSAGTWTMSQDTDVPSGQGFSNSVKLDCTTADASLSAGDVLIFEQRLEGQMLQHLKYGTSSAEKLTLSFWVKSNKTGTYILELYSNDNGNKQVSKTYTIDTADTWEKKIITIDGDTADALDNDNNRSIACNFWFASGTTFTSGTLNTSWASSVNANRAAGLTVNLADSTANYINITGCQLEISDGEATPFEHRPYDMELQRCKRYYIKEGHGLNGASSQAAGINGFWWNPTDVYGTYWFPVEMRTAPDMSSPTVSAGYRFHGGGNFSDEDTIGGIGAASRVNCYIRNNSVSGGTAGQACWMTFIAAGAYVEFSAEL